MAWQRAQRSAGEEPCARAARDRNDRGAPPTVAAGGPDVSVPDAARHVGGARAAPDPQLPPEPPEEAPAARRHAGPLGREPERAGGAHDARVAAPGPHGDVGPGRQLPEARLPRVPPALRRARREAGM